MACNQVGGLSGAFIPVSEDEGMIAAVSICHINLEKLEAMTAICSVGLDMIAIPADTPDTTIAAMMLMKRLSVSLIRKQQLFVSFLMVRKVTCWNLVVFLVMHQ